jgi:hypothetical protein
MIAGFNTMSLLKVPYLPNTYFSDSIATINYEFSKYVPCKLIYEPWQASVYKPDVAFNIAYGDNAVYLKFFVKEKYFRAEYKKINEPVYKDSCVEFFISLTDDRTYYNFEFNALGTALVAYGSSSERVQLPASVISQVKSLASHKTSYSDHLPFQWELTLAIPFDLFCANSISTLNGTSCKANFYKCGDELPEPHFLCWSNIIAPKPDFHLPQYFGNLIFE